MMDVVLLSRLQFTLTAIVHYFFVPLTLGLAVLIAYMEYKYWRTNEKVYDRMARFWTRLFLINFAVGVATGITMEFQFGTNWADYSRFVGDIFGAPLAAEAVFAFFLESTFIGLLVFGRDKISRGMRFFSAVMVAVGTNLSAFWIIAANSWQQTPAGFVVEGNRAFLTSFSEAIFNPSTLIRLTHTLEGAYITTAFFVIAVSSYYLLNKRNTEIARKSLKIGVVFGLVFALLQLVSGHSHAVQVANTQPAKLAAYEAHWDTTERASMVLFAIPNAAEEKNNLEIAVPGLLSFLVYNDASKPVTGLKEFPREERPPVGINFFSFRIMVGIGLLIILVMAYSGYQLARGTIYDNKSLLTGLLYMLPLPYIANTTGWIVAEVGRQPWAVYGVLTTADAVSNISAAEVMITLVLFLSVYAFLGALMVYLMVREVRKFDEDVVFGPGIDRPVVPGREVSV
ncbi:cytochrome ubiquinol oxidase subunit I [Desulfitibacter alkalitolerans]|uniref:cytochrome ubiquinol oxidase subunit I n=1 Tax=Desulfitibacter alkalitolerans TaxID=264641 RepID=UPI000AAFD6F9|nr:cytochrome ubiquinol oxidase subunit I [Desulfitibacter alkalitolerans]